MRFTAMVQPKKLPLLDLQILFLGGILLAGLSLIGVRLWSLQVRMERYYRTQTGGNSEITVRIPPTRGEIRDRDGVVLVTN